MTSWFKSRVRAFCWLVVLGTIAITGALPASASAHGPIAPIASSYLARVSTEPPGLEAKIVDGDLRMWLQVRRGLTVIVLDYRQAPYLRFSPSGVEVNENSSMYYLNQTPALIPPTNLSATTPTKWHRISGGTTYEWHEGRLHGLAAVALTPGHSFVGTWQVPVLVDGRRMAITGGLWHADNPSLVWFWPIAVMLACVLAGWRLHLAAVDRLVARGLAVTALIGVAAAVLTRELHGRPTVTVIQLIEIAAVLAFAVWALHRLLFARHGYFLYFVIAMVALWQGAALVPTLLQGFVLAAGPAFIARAASVICLGTGISLLPMVFRIAAERDDAPAAEDRERTDVETEDDSAWEFA